MKKKLPVLPFVIFTIMACNNGNDSQSRPGKDSSQTVTSSVSSKELNADIATKDSGYLLTYKNDSLYQRMRVKYVNKKKIHFTLTTTNTPAGKQTVLTGEAEMDDERTGDLESDTGEDGMAFFYDNWHYVNGKCQLYMRISQDSASYIRIYEFDCEKFRDARCPFQTEGVLQRTDIKR
jgi:hypothetical protein